MDQEQNYLTEMPVPEPAEARAQAALEPDLFPAPERIDSAYLELSQLYQLLFGRLFKARTGIEGLEERIRKEGFRPAGPAQKNYYQRYSCLGLSYFYLRGIARVERLSAEEQALLRQLRSGDSGEDLTRAEALVEQSFSRVMPVCPEAPETVFEPVRTLHGDYRIPGRCIPLGLKSTAEFLPDGSLASEEQELRRLRVFTSIWNQIDAALTADLGCETKTAIELFDT